MTKVISITLLLLASLTIPAMAEIQVFEITIKNHRFQPDTLTIPANQKVKLLVKNADSTPEEFESYELNREKIIPGNSKAYIFIGPLEPGEYPFFGEFNMKTALGKITVK